MTGGRLRGMQRVRKETQQQLEKLRAALPREEPLRAEVCMYVAVGYFDISGLARTVMVVWHYPLAYLAKAFCGQIQ